ncbi:MAG: ETC complex I subunit [Alphaproteobacteria bacterium]|nr:ETC complex I subunit [Alphaproteobacteria bacterium]MDE2041888.1 ETC complex I subunit [Alphaproteobacteria bacterium]MDE2339652.1 ETC complex I subunit [Alphaproteobacteria bacterium]
MSHARIYQKPKNAMQSGRATSHDWYLDYERTSAQRPDVLTGWAGSGDTRQQIRLRFETLEEAQDYARKHKIVATVIPAAPRALKLQAYADNFR